MREVEKKDIDKKETVTNTNSKASYEDQKKNKSLQNRLSKIESQIQQLEKDIQNVRIFLHVTISIDDILVI